MPDDRTGVTSPAPPALVRVAHVRRPHGVRGEVRVQALGGGVERFAPGTTVVAETARRPLTVSSSRALDGDELLLAFAELPEREDAAALNGDYLCVQPAQLRALGAEEWFVWQLVGLRAVTEDGTELGVVRDVEEQPSSDVIVVAGAGAERRYPLVRQWISSVDVGRGLIVVTPWPEDDD